MIPFGRKNIKMTRTHQQKTFIIHPPWCKWSRGSFWFFTPIINTAKMVKNKKFPKLTRKTASVSNHSRSGVLWKVLIQGIFSMRGAATSLKIHETIREKAKRPQYAIRADRRPMLETTDWQAWHAQTAQHWVKQEAAHIFSSPQNSNRRIPPLIDWNPRTTEILKKCDVNRNFTKISNIKLKTNSKAVKKMLSET